MIRVGVTFNRTHYFVDKGTQRGLTFAHLKKFEDDLNAVVPASTSSYQIEFQDNDDPSQFAGFVLCSDSSNPFRN